MLQNLPNLPIHPETKCLLQEDADRIFGVLCTKYPELLKNIELVIKDLSMHPVHMDDSYLRVIDFMRSGCIGGDRSRAKEVKEAFKPLPDTALGFIDLTFELWRRCRVTAGYSEPEIKGQSLASSYEGGYPEKLVDKPISVDCQEIGYTQDQVDQFVELYYEDNKKLCYIVGEVSRRDLYPLPRGLPHDKENDPSAALNLLPENEDTRQTNKRRIILRNEAHSRVSVTCQSVTLEEFKRSEDIYLKNRELSKQLQKKQN
tara:strand:+ start:96 stop:872 length:777 start_codon:yes stop_codon:yes gene_type:complete